MDHVCLTLPLLAGRSKMPHTFMQQLDGARRDEFDSSERRIGIWSSGIWRSCVGRPPDRLHRVCGLWPRAADVQSPRVIRSCDIWFKRANDGGNRARSERNPPADMKPAELLSRNGSRVGVRLIAMRAAAAAISPCSTVDRSRPLETSFDGAQFQPAASHHGFVWHATAFTRCVSASRCFRNLQDRALNSDRFVRAMDRLFHLFGRYALCKITLLFSLQHSLAPSGPCGRIA